MLKEIGRYASVAKVNVSDLDSSVKWYKEKLDMKEDIRFAVPGVWRQLKTGIPFADIGLNLGTPTGTGEGVFTFVVNDISRARAVLIARDVKVSEIQDVGRGVLLAFFKDPSGNSLGLRQNSKDHPSLENFNE